MRKEAEKKREAEEMAALERSRHQHMKQQKEKDEERQREIQRMRESERRKREQVIKEAFCFYKLLILRNSSKLVSFFRWNRMLISPRKWI